MEQPRNLQLAGTESPNCLLQVVKGVFGLPDAPRAWWTEFSTLKQEFKLESLYQDQAFFVWRHDDGKLGLMLVVHVDDVLVAHDGAPDTEAMVNRLKKRYPFGEWQRATEGPVTYTGKTIEVVEVDGRPEVRVHQIPFIRGRLNTMPLEKQGRHGDTVVTGLERSEYKSVCGSLSWVAGLTRPDIALDVNMCQKRQAAPRVKDCERANALVEMVQKSEDTVLRILPVPPPLAIACWTDSALYNTYDEAGIEDDEELSRVEKDAVRSQHGVLVSVVSEGAVAGVDAVATSPIDWLSRASRRVVRSTFAAETGGALEAVGRGLYARAMLAEIVAGPSCLPHERGESPVSMKVVTDCKSVYDNVSKECSLCDDRHTALYIAALRQSVSAGPQRDEAKSELLWVPSRHQLADGLTKSGFGDRIRDFLREGRSYFHELSAQALRRRADQEKLAPVSNDLGCDDGRAIGQHCKRGDALHLRCHDEDHDGDVHDVHALHVHSDHSMSYPARHIRLYAVQPGLCTYSGLASR